MAGAQPFERARELGVHDGAELGSERLLDEPAQERPSEVAMTDLLAQDAIERTPRDRDTALLA